MFYIWEIISEKSPRQSLSFLKIGPLLENIVRMFLVDFTLWGWITTNVAFSISFIHKGMYWHLELGWNAPLECK